MEFYEQNSFRTGAIFGLVAPFVGMTVGLVLSSTLGSILMGPIVFYSKIMEVPFGNMSIFLKIVGLLLSVSFWGLLFLAIDRLFFRKED